MTTASASRVAPNLVLLDSLERRVILYLRLLQSGPQGRGDVEEDLAARAGPGAGEALARLEILRDALSRALARPLEIRHVDSVRPAADEMLVAALIAAAADRGPAPRCQASRVADPAGAVARAAEAVAGALVIREVARCSCGRIAEPDGHAARPVS